MKPGMMSEVLAHMDRVSDEERAEMDRASVEFRRRLDAAIRHDLLSRGAALEGDELMVRNALIGPVNAEVLHRLEYAVLDERERASGHTPPHRSRPALDMEAHRAHAAKIGALSAEEHAALTRGIRAERQAHRAALPKVPMSQVPVPLWWQGRGVWR